MISKRRPRPCLSGFDGKRTGSEGGLRFRSGCPPRVRSTRWNLPYSPQAVNPSFRHSDIPALAARSPGFALAEDVPVVDVTDAAVTIAVRRDVAPRLAVAFGQGAVTLALLGG